MFAEEGTCAPFPQSTKTWGERQALSVGTAGQGVDTGQPGARRHLLSDAVGDAQMTLWGAERRVAASSL